MLDHSAIETTVPGLSDRAKALLTELNIHSGFSTLRELADATKMSKTQRYRALKELTTLGFITELDNPEKAREPFLKMTSFALSFRTDRLDIHQQGLNAGYFCSLLLIRNDAWAQAQVSVLGCGIKPLLNAQVVRYQADLNKLAINMLQDITAGCEFSMIGLADFIWEVFNLDWLKHRVQPGNATDLFIRAAEHDANGVIDDNEERCAERIGYTGLSIHTLLGKVHRPRCISNPDTERAIKVLERLCNLVEPIPLGRYVKSAIDYLRLESVSSLVWAKPLLDSEDKLYAIARNQLNLDGTVLPGHQKELLNLIKNYIFKFPATDLSRGHECAIRISAIAKLWSQGLLLSHGPNEPTRKLYIGHRPNGFTGVHSLSTFAPIQALCGFKQSFLLSTLAVDDVLSSVEQAGKIQSELSKVTHVVIGDISDRGEFIKELNLLNFFLGGILPARYIRAILHKPKGKLVEISVKGWCVLGAL